MQRRRSPEEGKRRRRDWGAAKMQQTRRGGRKKERGGKKKKKKESRNGRGNGLQTFPLALKRTAIFLQVLPGKLEIRGSLTRGNRGKIADTTAREREERIEVNDLVRFFIIFFRGILISRSEKYWKGVHSSDV